MRHQQQNVRIDGNNVCLVNNEMCKNNATPTCYSCQIMAGNVKFPIKFVPGLTIPKPQTDIIKAFPPQPIFNARELVLPKVPDLKITLQPLEEDDDTPNFVKHVSGVIRHFHAENMRFHRHFICNQVGDRCIFCGAPIVGTTHCDMCNSLFNDLDQVFVLAEKVHLSSPIHKAS